MDRHHPHLISVLFQVALDLRASRRQPVQKPLQRGRMGALEIQGEVEKLIYGIVGVPPQPCGEPSAPVTRPQKFRVKGKR